MKLGKMSLAAAVAIAGLSTASFADGHGIKVAGELETNIKYNISDSAVELESAGDLDGSITASAKSEDGKGSAKVSIKFEAGDHGTAVSLNGAEFSYDLGMATLTAGPKTGIPGSFTDNPSSDVFKLSIPAGPATINVGGDLTDGDYVGAAVVAAGPATVKADFRMKGEESAYAAVVSAKVAGASIGAGYAGGDNTIMGGSLAYGVAGINAFAQFSTGTTPSLIGAPSVEIGDNGDGTVINVGATTALMGATVGGSFKNAGETSSINVGYDRALNAQTKLNFDADITLGGSMGVSAVFATSF